MSFWFAQSRMLRSYRALQFIIVLLGIVSMGALSIQFQNAQLVKVFYPWILPFTYFLPGMVEWHSNQILNNPKFQKKDFVFALMPFISCLSILAMFLNKDGLYEANVNRVLAIEFLEIQHGLNTFFTAALFMGVFSLTHALVLIFRLRELKSTYPAWVYLTIPCIELMIAIGMLVSIVASLLNIKTGVFLQMQMAIVAYALFMYSWQLKQVEKKKRNGILPQSILFKTRNATINRYLQGISTNVQLELCQDFSKKNLADFSAIGENEWNAYLMEVGLSWPEFKYHIRVRYAIVLLNEGYLERHTLSSLIESLGMESRSSFYRAYLMVTQKSFRVETFKKK